jgi:integrase
MIPTHDSSKSENKYFTDNIPIMDGGAFVHKTPRSGGIWQFRMWVKEEGRHVRKTLKTRDLDEALELGRRTYAEILGQTASGKKLFGTSFADACQQWLETQQKRVDTGRIVPARHKTISTQINRHVIPFIEQHVGKKAKVGSLSYNSFYDFAQFRRTRNPEVQEVTIRNEHTTIGSLMKWCFRKGFTNFDKCEFEEIRIREAVRRDTFTLNEYETLYRYMRGWVKEDPDYRTAKSNMMPLKKKQFFRDMVLLNANNLMRIGELRQLTWGMVKNVKKGKDFYTEYVLPAAICKNRKSRTFIARGGEYLNRIKSYSNFTDKDDFVICNNDDGQQISKTELYRMWKDVMEGIGLENYQQRKLTFYSLRHFAITGRLYAGVPVYEIAKDAGTSLTYIEKHYDHLDMKKLITNASKSFRVDKDGIVERYQRDLE